MIVFIIELRLKAYFVMTLCCGECAEDISEHLKEE
jgi:hypothetical protein